MTTRAAGFDWYVANREKCPRHGVPVREIESIFGEPVAVVPDPAHSGAEERFKAIGTTAAARYVFVVFTLRGCNGTTLIRPITARYMRRDEVEYYEKAVARVQNR